MKTINDFKKKIINTFVNSVYIFDDKIAIYYNLFGSDKITYEEAKETVLKALSILGEDYISTLAKGLENNWVDVYPSLSKRTGGYSGGS